jgi:hypothetical protein
MVHFDDTLDVVARVLSSQFGERTPPTTIVRDASGSIAVVLPDDALKTDQWDALAQELHRALGRFSAGARRVLLRESDLIEADDVLRSPDRVVVTAQRNVWVVDRLLTNQDWVRTPLSVEPPIPTATAFSIKGGVGRSTAFAILAWHLARAGRKVLVVDLDLEAPGIGSMLLGSLPEYGVVDWCVESLFGQADGGLLEAAIAPAPLADEADGEILVVPAFGTKTRDYVAKVGRAYMPAVDDKGRVSGLADRLQALLVEVSRRLEPPDVVLLDSRAGLHDIGSAAVTQLGAEVFVFARDDAQTWDAYSRLFDHLQVARGVSFGMPEQDLRWRLKMVAAQVEPTEAALESWLGRSYLTWTEFYDDEEREGHGPVFDQKDEAAPHYPLPISFDSRIRGMNLVDPDQRPDWGFVSAAFGPFLEKAVLRVLPDGVAGAGGAP